MGECEVLKKQVKSLHARQQEYEELLMSYSSHQEDANKTTDVAWQLCGLLRDYVRHLLDSQSACAPSSQVQTMLVRPGSPRVDSPSRPPSPKCATHPPPMAAANLPVHNQPITVANQRLDVRNPAHALPPPMAAVPAPPHPIQPNALPVSVAFSPRVIANGSVVAEIANLTQSRAFPAAHSAIVRSPS